MSLENTGKHESVIKMGKVARPRNQKGLVPLMSRCD
jgi:hypothetical protein